MLPTIATTSAQNLIEVKVGWCAGPITAAAAPYAIAEKLGWWYRQAGIHVEEGNASVTFGDANFGGGATFHYSETDGFGFDGYLNIQVMPGKRIRLAIAYPSENEAGVAEDGTFDASVTLPPPEGGEGVSTAGWELWGGIQPEELVHLFDRNGTAARARGRGGRGLGLLIAEGLIRAHSGRIWAESELGRGSRFHFTVPLATPRP